MRSFLFLLTWMEFFPPSGRSCTCEILLGLEELLTYSPCCQLVRLEVLVKVLPYSVRVIECYSVLWFLHVLPQKNCVLVTGCSSPFFLTYWYADLLRVREKTFSFSERWQDVCVLCVPCELLVYFLPRYFSDMVCLITTGTPYTQQSYKVSESFPYKWINKKWKEGFHVTSMATAGNRWGVVMSSNSGYATQVTYYLNFYV